MLILPIVNLCPVLDIVQVFGVHCLECPLDKWYPRQVIGRHAHEIKRQAHRVVVFGQERQLTVPLTEVSQNGESSVHPLSHGYGLREC